MSMENRSLGSVHGSDTQEDQNSPETQQPGVVRVGPLSTEPSRRFVEPLESESSLKVITHEEYFESFDKISFIE